MKKNDKNNHVIKLFIFKIILKNYPLKTTMFLKKILINGGS